VFAPLVIQNAMRVRHMVICGIFWLFRIFPRCVPNGTVFNGNKKLFKIKYVFCFYLLLLKDFLL